MTDASQQGPASSPTGLPCPVCRVDLVMSERQGIEIDYCPKCRGVWLDRGELDKIIERAAAEQPATPSFLGGVAQQQGGASFPRRSSPPGSSRTRAATVRGAARPGATGTMTMRRARSGAPSCRACSD